MHCKDCQFGVGGRGGGGGVPSQLLVTSLCAMTLSMATATFTGLKCLVRTDLLLSYVVSYDERENKVVNVG